MTVESEYKYAAEAASTAWQALTGREDDAPMSKGFRELLMSVVTGAQVGQQAQQKPPVSFRTKLRCLVTGNIDGLMGRISKNKADKTNKNE